MDAANRHYLMHFSIGIGTERVLELVLTDSITARTRWKRLTGPKSWK